MDEKVYWPWLAHEEISRDPVAEPDREKLEAMGAEYSVLEMLLLAMIDGYEHERRKTDDDNSWKASRALRLKTALKSLTNQEVDRSHEPDSKMSQALIEMAKLQEQNYLSWYGPEGTAEERDLQSFSSLADAVLEKYELNKHQDKEVLRKRFSGSYERSVGEGKELEHLYTLLARGRRFNHEKEQAVLHDFRKIAEILEPYGIKMKLDTVFWRVVGSNS